MNAAVIEAHAVARNFGATPVLRAIELRVAPGRAAVVLGGNGAGKSTLVAILAGLAAPSFGRALLFGEDARALAPDKRRRLGVMTHQSFLYPNLTARENLEFYAALYRLAQPRMLVERWLVHVGLEFAANERVRALSRGMEQRLAIARAMLADPDALIMDEPFAGLDPAGVAIVAALVREAVERGCAVLITAHQRPALEGLELECHELSAGRLAPHRAEAKTGRLRRVWGG
jgi:heme ABC exporter ATP-binding subunit CcmA